MNSRERVLTTLNHQEPDRVPYDLASTQITGIQVTAYRNLRQTLGLPPVKIQLYDHIQQLALPDDDLMQRLGVDTRALLAAAGVSRETLDDPDARLPSHQVSRTCPPRGSTQNTPWPWNTTSPSLRCS